MSSALPETSADVRDYLATERFRKDPVAFSKAMWPHVTLYRQQRELMYSVRDNFRTFCPAGNMLGKDFVTGMTVLWFFLTRHPCRILTTSADSNQLESVLWGEIGRFLQGAAVPLLQSRGGPVVDNHLHLRKMIDGPDGAQELCRLSYVRGRVAAKGEGMLGHHVADVGDGIPRTLFVADEASGVDDASDRMAETWAKRMLAIGNPYPCANFFFRGVEAGDLEAPPEANVGMYRKILRITGHDSPNVRLASAQIATGRRATGELLIEGVLPYDEYLKRLATWDKVMVCIGIEAQFYKGAELLLFPPEWLNRAGAIAATLPAPHKRQALAVGVDPAEGGDNTAIAVVDQLGLMDLISCKTPNTQDIITLVIDVIKKYNVDPERVMFDRGGGGTQLAGQLREHGYAVRSVGFGESVAPDPKYGRTPVGVRVEQREERYEYFNRRAQMYGLLSALLDPSLNPTGFGIPRAYGELRRQLALIPKKRTQEGRLKLPPKRKRDGGGPAAEKSLEEILGCSPDEADALVLAVYSMELQDSRAEAGVCV